LTNRQLVELVRQRPQSKAGIGRIDGLGEKKVARHGDAIRRLRWSNGPGASSSVVPQDAWSAVARSVTVVAPPV
ncbi:MAG: HRDC domain-containing protein, partial [Planctomycetota bacterium]